MLRLLIVFYLPCFSSLPFVRRVSFVDCQAKAGKKDEIKIAKSREQMEEARRLYEVLNKELHDELPALFDSRIPFLISSLQTLFASETLFHGELQKINSQFAELVDALANEAQKGAYHSSVNQRQLAFNDSSPKANGGDGQLSYEDIDGRAYNGDEKTNGDAHLSGNADAGKGRARDDNVRRASRVVAAGEMISHESRW